jgi:glucokinase
MVARAVAAPLVIGLDVGGTKILSGLVDRDGQVVAQHEIHSPGESQADVLAALDAAVEELLDDRVVAIGYGIPANLERGTGRILHATNLPLESVDLVSRSNERYGLPVGVENDANVAALAEWKRGAGRGSTNLVMLTLGTGVGGGIVLDGRLFRGCGSTISGTRSLRCSSLRGRTSSSCRGSSARLSRHHAAHLVDRAEHAERASALLEASFAGVL